MAQRITGNEGNERSQLTRMAGWVVGALGIPLAAILTWVFSAGQLSFITNQNASRITEIETRVRTIEAAQIRTQEQYNNIIAELKYLKEDIRRAPK